MPQIFFAKQTLTKGLSSKYNGIPPLHGNTFFPCTVHTDMYSHAHDVTVQSRLNMLISLQSLCDHYNCRERERAVLKVPHDWNLGHEGILNYSSGLCYAFMCIAYPTLEYSTQ